jgi:hypothetical protein
MTHTDPGRQSQAAARALVRTIGLGLHRQVFPTVGVGGLVLPSVSAGVHRQPEKEQYHVSTARGSSARPRQRSARREREASGFRSAGSAAQVFRSSSAAECGAQLTQLTAAYPTSRMWVEVDGIWLVVHSRLVEGLEREAVFIVAIPFDATRTTQGWGFWSRGCLAFTQWIGPRHTNFPFGSICAFDARDNVWATGDSPVLLLDLYSVWALKHLYTELFGQWPGSQTARWAYERQHEWHEDELCGCGSPNKTYGECCRPEDLQRDRVRDALEFLNESCGGERSPPPDVMRFLRTQSDPPSMAKYL